MAKMSFFGIRVAACWAALLCFASPIFAASNTPVQTGSKQAAVVSLQQKPKDLLAGQSRAVAYSGFRSGQHPDRGQGAVNPSDAEILQDLEILSRQTEFRLIRLYDSQVNAQAVLRLIAQHKLNFRVMLGVWLDAEVSNPNCPWHPQPYPDEVLARNKKSNAAEVQRAIRLARKYPNIVVAVNVGNEALVNWTDHLVPEATVIRYVRTVKKAIRQPVTVAENYEWWAKHGAALAKELDFVTVHIYPIWEERDIDAGMSYSIANLETVRKALPNSRLVIGEAGWATTASEFGPRASEAKQKRYYEELFAWTDKMNITTFFFEAFDEDWKGNPKDPLGAEKHWGLFFVDRKPKLVMQR